MGNLILTTLLGQKKLTQNFLFKSIPAAVTQGDFQFGVVKLISKFFFFWSPGKLTGYFHQTLPYFKTYNREYIFKCAFKRDLFMCYIVIRDFFSFTH